MARSYILSGIILASLFQAVFLNGNDKCPQIKVKKDQIIRTKESLDNGAKYLEKKVVKSAKECYQLCCGLEDCNVGMLSYKNDSYGHLVRNCYLFDCGQPSKCTFSSYKHYATILFDDRENGDKSTRSGNGVNQGNNFQSKQDKKRLDPDCPPDAPSAMCYSDPCVTATCPSHPWAVCKLSTCGTCHAVFVNDDGDKVKCYDYRHKPKPAHSGSNKFSESNILNEIERLHNKDLHNHPVHHKDQNTDLETGLHDYTKQKPASHRSTSTSTSDDKARKKETDPPFHEWRKFIDNNPKYGKANLATEKPTAKPTTFHHWREFIDNNPKYTKPPVKTKNTRKPTPKTTLKLITHHVITKTKPAVTVEKPITNSPPKVNDESNRARNISDVVVIETSHLRIVENKAVVPLAIFLVVSLVLLILVVLRLRVMKSRLRRKAFATDDADYLINGMYL